MPIDINTGANVQWKANVEGWLHTSEPPTPPAPAAGSSFEGPRGAREIAPFTSGCCTEPVHSQV